MNKFYVNISIDIKKNYIAENVKCFLHHSYFYHNNKNTWCSGRIQD